MNLEYLNIIQAWLNKRCGDYPHAVQDFINEFGLEKITEDIAHDYQLGQNCNFDFDEFADTVSFFENNVFEIFNAKDSE